MGEHVTHDTDEDDFIFNDQAVDQEVEAKSKKTRATVTTSQLLQNEFEQLAKRSYVVRRGRNNRLLVRPIMEMIFDEGPNSYELSHGLPGQNLLENQQSSNQRIYGVGNNFYQRRYVRDILKKS